MTRLGIAIIALALNTCTLEIGEYVEPAAVVKQEREHLPTKCAPYYNDGTDQWIECMGVGRK